MKRPTVGDGSHIKGACLVEALVWLEKSKGRARVEAALARIPNDGHNRADPHGPRFGILASEWYPASHTHAVLDAMTAELSREEQRQMARNLAKAVMEGTLRGVYGLLFSMMATPERYARHAPRLWSKYYDGGRVRFELPTRNSMIATISEWPGHHTFLCCTTRFARVAALEAMGCPDVRSEWRCKSEVGGDACVTELRWG
jgi:hypothetical protein